MLVIIPHSVSLNNKQIYSTFIIVIHHCQSKASRHSTNEHGSFKGRYCISVFITLQPLYPVSHDPAIISMLNSIISISKWYKVYKYNAFIGQQMLLLL